MTDLQVLVIEDDEDVRLGCLQALILEGLRAEGVGSVEKAERRIGPDFPGVVVSDIRLPGRDGLSFMRELVARDPTLPVILITGHGDVATAVQAMRDGAYDFIQKPFSSQILVDVVRRAVDKRGLALEVRDLRRQLAAFGGLDSRIIGRSEPMRRVRDTIAGVAKSRADVLIRGETGTGKELVARCLHDLSGARGNFVALNCGGLPETLFESEIFGHEAGAFTGAVKKRIGKIEHAAGGTLFLDEIESMPMAMQIKFLRVLQERVVERLGSNKEIPVDFRIVAATKADLAEEGRQGRFRSDLYFRLAVVTIDLPPLRARREDVPLLFDGFVAQAALRHGREPPEIDDATVRDLMGYGWPGNIRELRNLAERHVLGIGLPLGSPVADRPVPLGEAVDAFERSLITEELRRQNGNVLKTAKLLNVPKSTLFDKIRKCGLESAD
ncbi:sigma-54-dependent Fis family transcriptional regulator [Siculibacillus lacustris]|uniref:Sigma-54-dependent Fis family transcriptional regulator n=1 Tax=Siculibacillus lacustris TaxID=1549641 RepID=A0A4Q9VMX6_9HYPH|nr:sigma-54 dependent transcriptional regulator [Siculibacillus lacustris]TBW36101.1 sigma-54-dependent Fis family transcriptional regulator [Siculibacillus lacustris]